MHKDNKLTDGAVSITSIAEKNVATKVINVPHTSHINNNNNYLQKLDVNQNKTATVDSANEVKKKKSRKGQAAILTSSNFVNELLSSQEVKKPKLLVLKKLTKSELEAQLIQAQIVNNHLMNQVYGTQSTQSTPTSSQFFSNNSFKKVYNQMQKPNTLTPQIVYPPKQPNLQNPLQIQTGV